MYEFVFKFRQQIHENHAIMTVNSDTLEGAEKKVISAIGSRPNYLLLSSCKEL